MCIKKSMNNEQIIIILINFVTFILFYSYSIMNAANIDKLNNFFSVEIIKIYKKCTYGKVKNKKLTINDIIKYLFHYSNPETTKSMAASYANENINRSSFHRKIKNIPLDFFAELLKEIQNLHNEISNDKNNIEMIEIKKKLDRQPIILNSDGIPYTLNPVDGTCNNRIDAGVLITDSSLHIYDNNDQIPYSIINRNNKFHSFKNNKNNTSNKNNEISLFEKFIEKNNDLTNKIFIFDRAYSSYQLISKLLEKKIKFVIRTKDNLNIYDTNLKRTNPNFDIMNAIKNDKTIKIIENNVTNDKIFTVKTNVKKTLTVTNKYHLITNLGDAKDYSDNLIIKLYEKRWDIEVFFRLVKSLSKYEIFRIDEEEEINKMKYIADIIFILVKLIILITLTTNYSFFNKKLSNDVESKFNPKNNDMRFKKNKDLNKNKTYETHVNINFSHFYKIFCHKYLNLMIDGKLSIEIFESLKKDIIINKDKKDRTYERKSLIPFTKWYVKMYHAHYKDKKIYEAIITQNIDGLNKNLKTEANKILKDLKEAALTIEND
jgi:hypothetical protein